MKKNIEPKESPKETEPTKRVPMRQILIETDGANIHLIKAEVSGQIELLAILQNLIAFINKPK